MVAAVHRTGGRLDARALQRAAQLSRRAPAMGVPTVEVAQLHAQDRGLERVQAGGRAHHAVAVARALAVRAQQAHAVGQLGSVGDDAAAVAPRAQVLGRVEAEAADVAQRPDAAAAVAGAVRLAGVLDDGDPAPRERPPAAGPCPRSRRRGGPGMTACTLRGDGALDDLRRDQAGDRVDVDEARRGAGDADGLGRRDERVAGDDHLVAGPDAQRAQRHRQRVGAGGDADGLVGLAVGREVGLEVLDVRAEGERGVLGDGADLAEQLLEQLGVVAVQADERDRHLRGRGQGMRGAHAATASIAVDGAESRLVSSAWSARRPR